MELKADVGRNTHLRLYTDTLMYLDNNYLYVQIQVDKHKNIDIFSVIFLETL